MVVFFIYHLFIYYLISIAICVFFNASTLIYTYFYVQRSYSQELFDDCIKVLLKNAITPKVGTRVYVLYVS